ncbi:unnamed protein product [Bursaphelenchus xylophilus]|uniref:(pine wood nematode) hypothetical protein n=1 Tax=Bursaphelenchus xylophilus TaxID=6326 RepID=A0A7I8XGX0_BURXY|nr:unnamed protein product [Bursaphelenchus xylophilus]CAG9082223.1 unnamed protein product [Bursaphelenchus xylophilus]
MERREERRSGVPARLHARPLAHSEHIPNFGLVIRPAFGFRRPKTTMEREDRRSGVPARLHARPQRRSGVPARLHARPHRRSGVPARLHARPHAHAEHIPKFGLAVRPACGYRRPTTKITLRGHLKCLTTMVAVAGKPRPKVILSIIQAANLEKVLKSGVSLHGLTDHK